MWALFSISFMCLMLKSVPSITFSADTSCLGQRRREGGREDLPEGPPAGSVQLDVWGLRLRGLGHLHCYSSMCIVKRTGLFSSEDFQIQSLCKGYFDALMKNVSEIYQLHIFNELLFGAIIHSP